MLFRDRILNAHVYLKIKFWSLYGGGRMWFPGITSKDFAVDIDDLGVHA